MVLCLSAQSRGGIGTIRACRIRARAFAVNAAVVEGELAQECGLERVGGAAVDGRGKEPERGGALCGGVGNESV